MQAKPVLEEFSIEQIVPFFQPIYDLSSGSVLRYECLSRLVTQNDCVYLPSEFLYIVNRSQASALLTQRIFELSSAYCLPRRINWSINLFESDLNDATLVTWLATLFSNMEEHIAGIELSYEHVKSHPDLVHYIIRRLPFLHITIDDVFECEENLTALIESGVHAIKICGNTITRYAKTGEGKEVIQCIQKRCENHACKLIAEHIEDSQTLEAVKDLGIQYAQGFYLQQPHGVSNN